MMSVRSSAVARRLLRTLLTRRALPSLPTPLPPCRCSTIRSFSTNKDVPEAEVVEEKSSKTSTDETTTTTSSTSSSESAPDTKENQHELPTDFEKMFAEMKHRMGKENNDVRVTTDKEDGMDVEEGMDLEKEPAFVEPPSNEVKKGDGKKLAFQTETRQILDIVANSLYTDKEVFLRELISNASDALEKARYLQSTNQTLVDPDKPFEIRITLNEAKNTITIQDHGIGMTADELVSNLGTIARSGSKAFVKEMASKGETIPSNIIGQFGVGFYASFMIADKVEVYSQSAKPGQENTAHYWVSDGTGSYEISDAENVARGTKVIVHLKPNMKEFAQKFIVEGIIKKYSNFVGFPIYLNNEKVNTVGAIWLADKSSVTPEQHTEFYRYIAGAYDSPYYTLHFSSDAPISIHALFYMPERHMEKFGMGRMDPGVSLYSRKVLIASKSNKILPEWLRFIKGVVDCEDIPLNISRENMQDSKLIEKLNSVLTRRVLRFLEEQGTKDPEKYQKFLNEFGTFLKEGICTDYKHRDDIAKLLRYETSKETKPISLDQYISNMSPSQKGIYYLCAPNRQYAEQSPYFETFQKKGIEVLFLYEHIDDFVMKNLEKYSKRKLISIESANVDEKDKDEKKDEKKDEDTVNKEKTIIEFLKKSLGDRVSKVTVTTRSISTPAIVVDHDSAALRRMMKMVDQQQGINQGLGKQKLEINPSHPIMTKMFELRESKPELATMIAEQVFDNALIAAGILDDPRSMLTRINKIIEAAQ